MIEVENVTKRFGPILAVDRISFQVARGEVVGFLGPNGAGKTTTMRIVACFFPPTSGRVSVGQHDVVTQALQVKQLVGYFPERVSVYPDLPVRSFLDFVAEAKDVPRAERKREVGRVMEACGLDSAGDRIIGHLSKGYRQRVGIAQALIHKPQVLILDEPTIGLDPEQVVEIRKLIRDLGSERTVILSTHILSEVSSVCDRVIIINQGRILASESLAELRAQLQRTRRVRVEVEGPEPQVRGLLERLPGVVQVREDGGRRQEGNGTVACIVEYEGEDIRKKVSRTILAQGWGLLEVRSLEPTLEDMYLQLIRDSEKAIKQ
ncbi:MAG: ATP-binding cassette domain-containing protein [Deltaproteobacteria bacterium]|nr:ATP-binding cassette domain-containing protein [Deltaproteobacteria bacterium]